MLKFGNRDILTTLQLSIGNFSSIIANCKTEGAEFSETVVPSKGGIYFEK
jgi:hypothetical protein